MALVNDLDQKELPADINVEDAGRPELSQDWSMQEENKVKRKYVMSRSNASA